MPKPKTEDAKLRRNRIVRLIKDNIDKMDDFEISRLEQAVGVAMGRVLYGTQRTKASYRLWTRLKERLARFSVHI